MLGSQQLPNFLVQSDMFMLVRVRVSSTEVLAGGWVLPLGCNANAVFTGIANAVWVHVKLDSFKRSPKAHLVEKVECLDGSKCYLFYCNTPMLSRDIGKHRSIYTAMSMSSTRGCGSLGLASPAWEA